MCDSVLTRPDLRGLGVLRSDESRQPGNFTGAIIHFLLLHQCCALLKLHRNVSGAYFENPLVSAA